MSIKERIESAAKPITRRDLFKRILGCAMAPAVTVSRPKFSLTYGQPEHRLHVYDGGVNFVRYSYGLNYLERKTPGRWGG